MGDIENSATGPDHHDDDLQALREGAIAPAPPTPPDCPDCGLPQDRYPTLYEGHWVLLEPDVTVPSHHLPPRRRWLTTADGRAWNTWDAEPTPGALCRVAHHLVCPYPTADTRWPWPWGTTLREKNDRRAQRLFNLPDLRDLPDAS
ncbi:DUF6083 domain-containing protein [Streptomyces sp. NPDC093149]|uniref:DUF6083 domain-containing protein n=1 Tax=Streptomyces sp. NPDC093149 TaxID=3366031 RepID=UPI003804FEE5